LFELIFLGTSASAPSIRRGLSAMIVKHEDYRFLIDCGEGTQRQILRSGVGFKKLNHILLTHGHLDHILGLAGLLSTFMRWEAIDEISIYGSRHTLDRVDDLIYKVVLRDAEPPMPIHLVDIKPGLIFNSDRFAITAFNVNHRGSDSLGYRFEEHLRRPFLPEKAEQLEIPMGPWRRDLVAGKSVVLPDGRTIHPDMVLGEIVVGTCLVVVGDVGRQELLLEEVRDADALVIESTYLEEEAPMAYRFGHTTAKQVAELAQQAGVKQLLLTHISRRYNEKEILAEASAVFPNTFVARDFDVFKIKHQA
jgi:ribonuclease Z